MHCEIPNCLLEHGIQTWSCSLNAFEDYAKQKGQWHNDYCAEAVIVFRVQSITVFLSDPAMNSNPFGCVVCYYWLVNGNTFADSPSHGYIQENHLSQEENAGSATDSSERTKKRKLPPAAKSDKYKTRMCRNYMRTGKCKYGRMCQFAHGNVELQKYSL